MKVRMASFWEFYYTLNSIFKLMNKIVGERPIKLFIIINDIIKFSLCRIVKFKGHFAHQSISASAFFFTSLQGFDELLPSSYWSMRFFSSSDQAFSDSYFFSG